MDREQGSVLGLATCQIRPVFRTLAGDEDLKIKCLALLIEDEHITQTYKAGEGPRAPEYPHSNTHTHRVHNSVNVQVAKVLVADADKGRTQKDSRA